ncbi:MAG: renalase [Candidatus Sumerlaeota bacterium]|nr:renalase [Candidatus Sumerlaeota bacterium]
MARQVAIIGAGIAGIAAAWEIRRHGLEAILLDRAEQPGGQLATIRGEGWSADVGAPFFDLAAPSLRLLLAQTGLTPSAVRLHDGVARLTAEGIAPRREFGGNRVALRQGWGALVAALTRETAFWPGVAVDAFHWNSVRRRFEMRDADRKRAVFDPVARRVLEVDGVILAVPGPEAAAIAANTSFLLPIAEPLSQVTAEPVVTGVFLVPAFDPGFCVLEGAPELALRWLTLEERKVPGRVPAGQGVVVACVGRELSSKLVQLSESDAAPLLWRATADILGLPAAEPLASRLIAVGHGETPPERQAAIPESGLPTDPAGIPFGLAGGWTAGPDLDAAAGSGRRAAAAVLARLS